MTGLTAAQLEERIAKLEEIRFKRLSGELRTKAAYERGMVEFATFTLDELNGEITRLKLELSKLTGCPSGLGPIRVGFGSRP